MNEVTWSADWKWRSRILIGRVVIPVLSWIVANVASPVCVSSGARQSASRQQSNQSLICTDEVLQPRSFQNNGSQWAGTGPCDELLVSLLLVPLAPGGFRSTWSLQVWKPAGQGGNLPIRDVPVTHWGTETQRDSVGTTGGWWMALVGGGGGTAGGWG